MKESNTEWDTEKQRKITSRRSSRGESLRPPCSRGRGIACIAAAVGLADLQDGDPSAFSCQLSVAP